MDEVPPARWYFALAGITALATAGIATIAGLALARCHIKSDPARAGLRWFKLASGLYFLGFLMTIVSRVADGVSYADGYDDRKPNGDRNLALTSYATSATGGIILDFADLSLLLTFVELGNGFMYALTGVQTPRHSLQQKASYIAILPLFIMDIVYIGYSGAKYSQYRAIVDGRPTDEEWMRLDVISQQMNSANKVHLAWNIIYCICTLLAVVQAALVQHEHRGIAASKRTVTPYLLTTIITLFPRKLWDSVYSGIITSSNNVEISLGEYVILNTVLTQLIVVATLGMLLTIGSRMRQGLWSDPQFGLRGQPLNAMSDNQSPSVEELGGQEVYFNREQPKELDSQQSHIYELGN